jgi:hypothetical protein
MLAKCVIYTRHHKILVGCPGEARISGFFWWWYPTPDIRIYLMVVSNPGYLDIFVGGIQPGYPDIFGGGFQPRISGYIWWWFPTPDIRIFLVVVSNPDIRQVKSGFPAGYRIN